MRKFLLPVAVLVLCVGCSESEISNGIQDGAEAATVAATVTLTATLPGEAALIENGLGVACNAALAILQSTENATTLQQVLDLAFVADPNLAKYKAIINFCLPVLEDIPGVTDALNTMVKDLPASINLYTQCFFVGVITGLGDAPGTTVEQLMARNPKLAKNAKRLGLGKFDVNALQNALKGLGKQK